MDEDLDPLELLYRPGVYVVTITPSIAAQLLERNTSNRRPKERAITHYAREMREGRWHVTNQGIGIGRDLVVQDGQNRLIACTRAGVPFRTVLATGLAPEARDVVDVGIKRSLNDVLTMHHIKNSSNTAGAISLRIRYEDAIRKDWSWVRLRGAGQRFSNEEMLAFLAEHPLLVERAPAAWLVRQALGKIGLAAIVAFESMSFEASPAAAAEFRESLISGAYLTAGDARLLLRNTLMKHDRAPDSIWTLGMFVKAWNLWRTEERRQYLRLQDTERLPRLLADPEPLLIED